MMWSVAEICALATAAARGGGAPPRQAQRFGQAAALHLAGGGDPQLLADALAALPQGPILECPRLLDAALAEGRGAIPSDETADMRLFASYVVALPFEARLDRRQGGLCLSVAPDTPRPAPPPRRIAGCAGLIAQMRALAERTFVPESETSRLSGAGAGLTDND